jgi:lipid-A-disaccharide synthase
MRVFISAGEPSGDLHAGNLLRSLRAIDPTTSAAGFGGEHLRHSGCDLLFPLADHAIMGLTGIASAIPSMVRLRRRFVECLRTNKPDAVVLIDYPGFHWWLAAAAKKCGVPVVSFVPPQVWAWATHRVNWVRRWFDHVLCSLPFEEAWYHERGVTQAQYVGHPYFDELGRQRLDEEFIAAQRKLGGQIVGLLPGSRGGEIERNLDTLIHAALRIRDTRADVQFLFACFKPAHKEQIERRLVAENLLAETYVGRTPEIIHVADACVAVSGSVGLELLHHGTPSIVVYRVNPLYKAISRRIILKVPYISIVNLLAGRELFPEHLTTKDPSPAVAGQLLNWLEDPETLARVRADLAALRDIVGRPGACRRAAELISGIAAAKGVAAA